MASRMKSNPGYEMDEKKRKRMISNKESARRSRLKKQKHMEDLINEKATLERKIYEDNQKYADLFRGHAVIDSENKILTEEKVRLAEYLKHLNRILKNCRGSTESDCDLNEKARLERQKRMEDLINEKATLEMKISEGNQKYANLFLGHLAIDSENKILREEKVRLAEYLNYLKRILMNCKGSIESDRDLNLVSESFFNLWQVHGSLQPITTSGLLPF